MTTIPLVDLKRQYQTIQEEIQSAWNRVVGNADFILGEEVASFEAAFAAACRASHAVGTSSGTTALHLALAALGIGPGDEVVTVANTFIATTEAISQAGARVVFADVNEQTLTMDPGALVKSITEKTRAVIPVHLYGQSADMENISAIARRHGLKIIEDAAQAHLAEFNGNPVGHYADAACFSFYPGKNLGAYGDAGIVVTSDGKLAEKMRMLANHGRTSKYEHLLEGYNYRLDALQAAILNVKLKYLQSWTERRWEIARTYDRFFKETDFRTPYVDGRARHVYHLYVIRSEGRERWARRFLDAGISTGIHYPIPLHLQPAYRYLGYRKGDLPVTEGAAEEILSLPLFPELTSAEIERIIDVPRREFGLSGSVLKESSHV